MRFKIKRIPLPPADGVVRELTVPNKPFLGVPLFTEALTYLCAINEDGTEETSPESTKQVLVVGYVYDQLINTPNGMRLVPIAERYAAKVSDNYPTGYEENPGSERSFFYEKGIRMERVTSYFFFVELSSSPEWNQE
jgi:hypothetical protein